MQGVLSLILGGGRGARLFPLTRGRSEPAVPIAGKYRLIDIPISNCINSQFNRIYVLTQYHSVSLHRHITNTYKFDAFSQGFVEMLAAQQTNETANWYRGTGDALRQNLRYIQADLGQDILVLSGDQLYRMDFRDLLATHVSQQADLTIAATPVTAARASNFGVLRIDDQKRLHQIVEKPSADLLPPLRTPCQTFKGLESVKPDQEYLANMGIYLFRREFLIELLRNDPSMDLVTQIFPRILKEKRIFTHLFNGYWQDVGTIRSYFEASLALAGDAPPFDFHTPNGVIFTHKRYLPASRVQAASMKHCLISDGCDIGSGTTVDRAIIGVRSRIGRNVTLRDVVILGVNPQESGSGNEGQHAKDPSIGDDCVLENVILDKNVSLGNGVRIVNQKKVKEADGPGYYIRDGIVIIPKDGVIPAGTVI